MAMKIVIPPFPFFGLGFLLPQVKDGRRKKMNE